MNKSNEVKKVVSDSFYVKDMSLKQLVKAVDESLKKSNKKELILIASK